MNKFSSITNYKDIAFVHINKTGGTSILDALGLEKEHLTAIEMRDRTSLDWENVFSFSFVRNPWDKVVSHYQYRVDTNQTNLKDNPLTFYEWVIKTYGQKDPVYLDNARMFMPQCNWITDEDRGMLVDFVGRFETLEKDFQELCKLIGISAFLPHLNSTKHDHYSTYYNNETREVIAQSFKEDILKFGYIFEN